MKRTLVFLAAVLSAFCAPAQGPGAGDPFSVSASLNSDLTELKVLFTIPAKHHLYADKIKVSAGGGAELQEKNIPPPVKIRDPLLDEDSLQYESDVELVYTVRNAAAGKPLDITVRYQGCSGTICFAPATRKLAVLAASGTEKQDKTGIPAQLSPAASAGGRTPASGWQEKAGRFTIAGKAFGYLEPDAFLKFLDNAEQGRGGGKDWLQAIYEQSGIWLLLLTVIIGGLGLNLTPCVLPMIPVNIAIIGAGVEGGSRMRGFLLGGVYGLGITVVYGLLGLTVVLAGARFGAINSSPWFNFAVAIIFLFMSLGMFGVINVDLSRFQGQVDSSGASRKGTYAGSFLLGGVAALLAGACVAPVVISVLLLSADIHARGNAAGLALPFLLGLGMALPWPFAGAGLSFLPKPGGWMEKVKYAFGIFIVVFALYYAYLGYTLMSGRSGMNSGDLVAAQENRLKDGWITSLDEAFVLAEKEKKPVFVDFWASWCKNCLQMERTTFSDPKVQERLKGYIRVKFRAEDMSSAEVKPALDYAGASGLPAYVVFTPGNTDGNNVQK